MADFSPSRLRPAVRIPLCDILFSAFIAAVVLLPLSPLVQQYPFRDSGVFLYSGWRVLEGETPYASFWDHKPPLIYFLNAAGLALGGGSIWGVWLIEWLFLSAACLLAFRLLRKTFGVWAAGLSVSLMLGAFWLLVLGGNYTTEFAIPLQFACFVLASGMHKDRDDLSRMVILGILGAGLFLLKQNLLGAPIVISSLRMMELARERKIPSAFRELGGFIAGFGMVLLPVVWYFVAHGALGDFWDAAFRFNAYYAETGIANVIKSALHGVEVVSQAGFGILGLVGWCVGIFFLGRKDDVFRSHGAWLRAAFWALPVELIFAALPGRFEIHYYLSVLPVFSIFTALALCTVFRAIRFAEAPVFLRLSTAGILFASLLSSAGTAILSRYHSYRTNDWSSVTEFIESNSAPGDSVLFWGAEAGMNFLTERRSPTKYIYQYPLYRRGFVQPEDVARFLHDLQGCPPVWIVDTKNPMTPFLDFPLVAPETAALRDWILLHYSRIQDVNGWTFYRWKGEPG
jgi:4-amino-4-deoxy-L-arabinose transferase-like glycosyltransferase